MLDFLLSGVSIAVSLTVFSVPVLVMGIFCIIVRIVKGIF